MLTTGARGPAVGLRSVGRIDDARGLTKHDPLATRARRFACYRGFIAIIAIADNVWMSTR
jgi:hypothetical protein